MKTTITTLTLFALISLFLFSCSTKTQPSATPPEPTMTPTLSPSQTPSSTPSSTSTDAPPGRLYTPSPTPSATSTPSSTPTPTPLAFVQGVDASYLPMIEEAGGLYFDNGVQMDALQILKNHGVNYIRLRLWHYPLIGYNNLDYTLKMAKRVKGLGMGLMIDIHYSDTWADPSKQYKPAAWADLPFDQLVTAVHDYTRDVIAALKKQGTLPDMVQIGNEITPGMLWDDGRVGGAFESNWPRLATLLKAGVSGVQDALSPGEKVQIVLHVDNGGNNETCRWWFDNVVKQQVPFDIIGLSYYPWWHGTFTDLENNLKDLAERYEKPILIVETGYPWSLENNDIRGNLVNSKGQLLPGYDATVDGQKSFLLAQKQILLSIPDGRGLGLIYWAGDDITTKRIGSDWENVALFDFQGNVLDSLNAFLTP